MDPVTQGVLGAALAGSLAKEDEVRGAVMIGALAGMAADLDVLIRSAHDPLLHLDFHRQFTHSLFFVPIGALVVAAFLYLAVRRSGFTFGGVYRFAFLGYATHAPLDSCTTYGTQLFWPFESTRIAFNNVAVIDLFFTLPLMLGVVWGAWGRKPKMFRGALLWGLLYLGLGVWQQHRAEGAVAELAAVRGHRPLRLEAKPTLGNIVLFRGIYEHDGHYYVDAVRLGLFGGSRVYEGGRAPRFFSPEGAEQTRQSRDIARFAHFSDGFLARHPHKPGAVGDIRYALLPNSVEPLWGIVVDPLRPEDHVAFENWREMDERVWPTFKAMILGRDP